jgi:hypothetical protein
MLKIIRVNKLAQNRKIFQLEFHSCSDTISESFNVEIICLLVVESLLDSKLRNIKLIQLWRGLISSIKSLHLLLIVLIASKTTPSFLQFISLLLSQINSIVFSVSFNISFFSHLQCSS